jgi:hypothetical protein
MEDNGLHGSFKKKLLSKFEQEIVAPSLPINIG